MINNEFLPVTDAIFKAAMTAGSPTVTTSMTTMISVMLVMMKMWWMMTILFISMHSFPRFIQTVSFLLLHICNICTARARASHVLYCCFVTHLLSVNNKQGFLQTELFLTNWLYGMNDSKKWTTQWPLFMTFFSVLQDVPKKYPFCSFLSFRPWEGCVER